MLFHPYPTSNCFLGPTLLRVSSCIQVTSFWSITHWYIQPWLNRLTKLPGVCGCEFTLHSKDPNMAIKNRKDVDIIDILQNYISIYIYVYVWIYVFHQSILVCFRAKSLPQTNWGKSWLCSRDCNFETFLHASTCGSKWWQNQFQSKANQLSLMSIGVWGYWVGNYAKSSSLGWEQEFDQSTRALNSHDSKLAVKG